MSQLIWSLPVYEIDDDGAHGIRFSGNDQFVVMAFNNYKHLDLYFAPYGSGSKCHIEYSWKNLYVYSVAALLSDDKHSGLYKFIQVAEDMTNFDVIITRVIVNKSNCGMSSKKS